MVPDVQQEQRVLGIERLRGVCRRCHLRSKGRNLNSVRRTTAMLDRVGDRFARARSAAALRGRAKLCPIRVAISLAAGVDDPGATRENNAMHDAWPGTGQHGDHGLGDQRQVDGDAVTGHQTGSVRRVRLWTSAKTGRIGQCANSPTARLGGWRPDIWPAST